MVPYVICFATSTWLYLTCAFKTSDGNYAGAFIHICSYILKFMKVLKGKVKSPKTVTLCVESMHYHNIDDVSTSIFAIKLPLQSRLLFYP